MLQHLITQDDALRMVPTDRERLTTAVEEISQEFQAIPAGRDVGRARLLARWCGIGLMSLGNYDEARAFLRQSLDLATASGNVRAVIATELNLGDAHRYAGTAEAADVLYRQALDSARSQHPELVDFALQHLGKHLMEQGDLFAARTHLWEARQLRIAKGDVGLIESTQAAVDRVEVLIRQAEAEAAQWSRRWTTWLQSRTTARTPARWEREFPALRNAVRDLTAKARVQPRHLPDEFPIESLASMTEEAEKALAGNAYLHNGKWNAAVGEAANRFAKHVNLAAVVARSTGLEVEQPHTGVYIAYLEEGQFLDFHLDEFGFGEANMILCLKHDRPCATPTVSRTVFIGADGYLECDLAPGDCLVFDGAITPHGRTPLSAGEGVILISFGFRALDRAPQRVARLPNVPG
ncbi:tetratricopeptide repeat protein [Streptomyces polychromogenes]|nr:tetratricopeptide repeat protein [Streptomyces polychromogenes]